MRIPNSGPVGPAQSVHGKIFWREFFKRPKLGLALDIPERICGMLDVRLVVSKWK